MLYFQCPKKEFAEDCPPFSPFSLSWGRQEDNFGQIRQIRQQQQQHAAYAWPHSQWLSLDDWVGLLPPCGVGCLQEYISCEEMCSVLSSAIRYWWSSSKEQLKWNHLKEYFFTPPKNYTGRSLGLISSNMNHWCAYEPSHYSLTVENRKLWEPVLKHHCALISTHCCRDVTGGAYEDTLTSC